jgi:hypothetical protein
MPWLPLATNGAACAMLVPNAADTAALPHSHTRDFCRNPMSDTRHPDDQHWQKTSPEHTWMLLDTKHWNITKTLTTL